jgi:hypothetical protein
MEEAARSPLAAWETFFFLVGSSGAALTGLQFVVLALIAESRRRATAREIQAFSTPTIVHFGSVLLVSAIISAPWHGLSRAAIAIGIYGILGILYTLITMKRARDLTTYRPVFEDWLWHIGLPLSTYALMFLAALLLRSNAHQSLFIVGFSALLLLFVGIHNAWDAVTYITVEPVLAKTLDQVDESSPEQKS